jgi:hypothetical protein
LHEDYCQNLYKFTHKTQNDNSFKASVEKLHTMLSTGEGLPPAAICPVTLKVMTDPVMTSTGHVVEASSVTDTCQITNQPLAPKVFPVIYIKKQILDWRLMVYDRAINLAE